MNEACFHILAYKSSSHVHTHELMFIYLFCPLKSGLKKKVKKSKTEKNNTEDEAEIEKQKVNCMKALRMKSIGHILVLTICIQEESKSSASEFSRTTLRPLAEVTFMVEMTRESLHKL